MRNHLRLLLMMILLLRYFDYYCYYFLNFSEKQQRHRQLQILIENYYCYSSVFEKDLKREPLAE